MRKLISKKTAVLAGLVAVIAAATAFAYLTATGSGSGSGTTSATTTALNLTSDPLSFTKLDQARTIKVYATNAGENPQVLSDLKVTVSAPAGCPAGSIVVGTPTKTGAQVPAGTTAANKVEVGSVEVTFANVNADQAACLGALSVGLSS